MTGSGGYDVFISYNHDEHELLKTIALRLQDEKNLNPWFDSWAIPGGVEWDPAIQKAMNGCKSCAVFLGSHGWGPYHAQEAEKAFVIQRERPSYPVIPVILPGANEQDFERFPGFFSNIQRIDFRAGIDDQDALTRLASAITGEAPYQVGQAGSTYLINRDAQRWGDSRKRDDSLLYRGNALRNAQKWASEHPSEMKNITWEFLQNSSELEQKDREAKERTREGFYSAC